MASNEGTTEVDIRPETPPVLPPRVAERDVTHYGRAADREHDAKIKESVLYSPQYDTSDTNLGIALVINNVKFRPDSLADRSGGDRDAVNIHQRLQELGFEVEHLSDATLDGTLQTFREIAQRDHSKNDCFFCVIMTHGDVDGVWATDGQIDLKELYKIMNSKNCPTLLGKPKIFIVQCCRGTGKDAGCLTRVERDVTVSDYWEDEEEAVKPQEDIIVVPNDMDFLLVYASADGKYSYRDTENGTPFINALCMELTRLVETEEEEDIYILLHKVNENVALNFQSTDGCKQMPNFVSMLRKPFKLRKKQRIAYT